MRPEPFPRKWVGFSQKKRLSKRWCDSRSHLPHCGTCPCRCARSGRHPLAWSLAHNSSTSRCVFRQANRKVRCQHQFWQERARNFHTMLPPPFGTCRNGSLNMIYPRCYCASHQTQSCIEAQMSLTSFLTIDHDFDTNLPRFSRSCWRCKTCPTSQVGTVCHDFPAKFLRSRC